MSLKSIRKKYESPGDSIKYKKEGQLWFSSFTKKKIFKSTYHVINVI